VAVALLTLAACAPAEALGPGHATVTLTIEHSRFTPGRIAVAEGTHVVFRVVNGDPIDHELIVGPAEVHERHEHGTEAEHGAVPGEVTVRAGETAETTYHFDQSGTVVFACHLPRHLAYGMRGEVAVTP
jgi:uncharacterized cupredoxin-like copper-binding protein